MSEADGRSNGQERRVVDALAEFDDRLAGVRAEALIDSETPIDPDLVPDWDRLTAVLSLVERAWPRDATIDPAIGDLSTVPAGPQSPSNGPSDTEPAPAGEGPAPVPAEEIAGKPFGRFRIIEPLGQGGYGIVFLAWDPATRRKVALKVPQPEALVAPESRKRFQREAHAAACLDHPSIVPVYETGSVGTIHYIAAAYCPGPSLAAWLERQSGPVPVRDAAELVATLARAVEHAHGRGVLHRDLKPGNVLLQPRAIQNGLGSGFLGFGRLADYQPRLTDFGLAKLADAPGPQTRSGIPFGSPPYMAPEQAEGRIAAMVPATDVYALGPSFTNC